MDWISRHLPSYPLVLLVLSLGVALLETLRPWRKEQRRFRPGVWNDLAFLAFNGHFLGVALYWLFAKFVSPTLERALSATKLAPFVNRGIASHWPLWLQALVVIVAMDFVQWGTHRLLHRVSWLWTFHKVHHSVVDGEMDFLVSFRFHWVEVIVYKTTQYLPLSFFGFSTMAVFLQAVVGTLVGHLNHSNLDYNLGPLRYVFNSSRMHLWHHDYDVEDGRVKNFGIVFSVWDWLFGTAYLPGHSPRKLGFPEVGALPRSFPLRTLWPLARRSFHSPNAASPKGRAG